MIKLFLFDTNSLIKLIQFSGLSGSVYETIHTSKYIVSEEFIKKPYEMKSISFSEKKKREEFMEKIPKKNILEPVSPEYLLN